MLFSEVGELSRELLVLRMSYVIINDRLRVKQVFFGKSPVPVFSFLISLTSRPSLMHTTSSGGGFVVVARSIEIDALPVRANSGSLRLILSIQYDLAKHGSAFRHSFLRI